MGFALVELTYQAQLDLHVIGKSVYHQVPSQRVTFDKMQFCDNSGNITLGLAPVGLADLMHQIPKSGPLV